MKNYVDLANKVVSIYYVAKLIGLDIPEHAKEMKSYKTHCPLGDFYHSDGGVDPAMRVYSETNSAYCFRCAESFSSVRLYARVNDLKQNEAADFLLLSTGYKHETMEDLWAEYNTEITAPPDQATLALALKIYCARIDSKWSKNQFNKDVSKMYTKCLSILEMVSNTEQADSWLKASKDAMRKVLELK